MKSHLIRVAVGSVLLLAASVLFVSAQDRAAATNTETQLTKTEVKALCMHATTAQDHLALASYLRGEAREAENMAQLQEAMSSGYQANPVSGTTTELQMHSKEIVESARRASASANEMAKEHEAIASRLQENTTATK
jgi:hypothetical protein